MQVLKNIFSRFYIYILWALSAYVLWAFIFGLVTDTKPEKKVVLFADVTGIRDIDLASLLEESAEDPVRMVQVHPFSYAMFSEEAISGADIYIVGKKEAADYQENFAVLNEEALSFLGKDRVYINEETGEVTGVLIYDAASHKGCAEEYIPYEQSESGEEDYYLFFSASSKHLFTVKKSGDDEALRLAEKLLLLP